MLLFVPSSVSTGKKIDDINKILCKLLLPPRVRIPCTTVFSPHSIVIEFTYNIDSGSSSRILRVNTPRSNRRSRYKISEHKKKKTTLLLFKIPNATAIIRVFRLHGRRLAVTYTLRVTLLLYTCGRRPVHNVPSTLQRTIVFRPLTLICVADHVLA